MPDDLVAGPVEDRDLALDDRDERVLLVADPEQQVADVRSPLLAELGEGRQLRRRQHRTSGTRHHASLPTGGESPDDASVRARPELDVDESHIRLKGCKRRSRAPTSSTSSASRPTRHVRRRAAAAPTGDRLLRRRPHHVRLGHADGRRRRREVHPEHAREHRRAWTRRRAAPGCPIGDRAAPLRCVATGLNLDSLRFTAADPARARRGPRGRLGSAGLGRSPERG